MLLITAKTITKSIFGYVRLQRGPGAVELSERLKVVEKLTVPNRRREISKKNTKTSFKNTYRSCSKCQNTIQPWVLQTWN